MGVLSTPPETLHLGSRRAILVGKNGPPEMKSFACDAALFDLDGVLVDSTAVVVQTWHRWVEEHGLDGERIVGFALGRMVIASGTRSRGAGWRTSACRSPSVS